MLEIGVFCNNNNFPYLEKAILGNNSNIAYKEVGMTIDANEFIKNVQNVKIDILILDTTAVEKGEEKSFLSVLTNYRISQNDARIIIIDLKREVGDFFLHEIVGLGIYDILSINDPEVIIFNLRKAFEEPKTLAHAIRYKVDVNINASDGKEKKAQLSERVVIKNQLVGRVMIALTGTHSRVGVTHISIALANYLHRKGYSVACLQLNDSTDIEQFVNTYDESVVKNDFLSLKGVDYYSLSESRDINIPFKRNYDFFVLDSGLYDENSYFINEFKRADVKGVVTTAREWEIKYLENFINNTEYEKFDLFVNYAFGNSEFEYLVNNLNTGNFHYSILKVNSESNLIDGLGLDDMFDNWLNKYIEGQSKENKKTGLLKNIFNKKK